MWKIQRLECLFSFLVVYHGQYMLRYVFNSETKFVHFKSCGYVFQQVPSRTVVGKSSAQDFLVHFKEEIPALGLLGTPHYIDTDYHYNIDKDVQLVCKYLRAYDSGVVDTLYNDFRGKWTDYFVVSVVDLILNMPLFRSRN